MTTQTRERTQALANGSAAALASPDRAASWRPQAARFTRWSPAGDVVVAYLARQAGRLKALDPLVRRARPDARRGPRRRGAQRVRAGPAHLAGENAFTFGLLEARAEQEAADCQDRARQAWQRAKRRTSRGWLSS